MSHELESNDMMVTGSRLAWHRLGKNTGAAMSMAEAIELAELDWTVIKTPLTTVVPTWVPSPSGLEVPLPVQQLVVPDRYATVRADTGDVLGVVGSDYTPFQNTDLADTAVGLLVEQGHVQVQTAGSLRGNRVVWFLLELADADITINGGKVVPYMLAMTSHDGSMAIRLAATPVYVVCANTMRMALHTTPATWTCRHTAGVQGRIAEAQEALGMATDYFDAWQVEAQHLLETEVTRQEFDAIVRAAFPMPDAEDTPDVTLERIDRQRDEVRVLAATAPEARSAEGTAWGTLQAFSSWDLWQRPVRGEKSAADADGLRAERQAHRIMAGTTSAWLGKVRGLIDQRAHLVRAEDAELAKLMGPTSN